MIATAPDNFAIEYDQWIELHSLAYQSEVETIQRFIPSGGLGVDIGGGTGRFSTPFLITIRVDPSEAIAAIARSRGITVHLARAERLPFEPEVFDFNRCRQFHQNVIKETPNEHSDSYQ